MQIDVHQNFSKKLFLSWWRHRINVLATFSKNNIVFSVTLYKAQILYIS